MRGCGAFVPLQWSGGWEDADRLFHGNGAEDGRMRIGCSMATERRMDGIGAFVRRNLSGGWGVTDHLHKGDGVTDGR